MDEARVQRRLEQRRRGIDADLDEIAEHVVVLDAERADIGIGGIARLQPGDHPAALVAELARLVEIAAVAVAHEAAVALQVRQVVAKRRADGGDQRGRRGGERRHRFRDLVGHLRPGADARGNGDAHGEPLADRRQVARGRRGRASGATARGQGRAPP